MCDLHLDREVIIWNLHQAVLKGNEAMKSGTKREAAYWERIRRELVIDLANNEGRMNWTNPAFIAYASPITTTTGYGFDLAFRDMVKRFFGEDFPW